ncbi:MAG: twin-arginine translocase TatA/TatE family subunit [Acidobacteriota bacterium]
MLGSLGVPEIIFILVLALLIFGPKRLPEIGRTVGKGLAEFRRATSEIQRTVNAELALEDDPRPVQYPRRVSLGEAENEAATARTPPAGALARGGAIGAEEVDEAAEMAAVLNRPLNNVVDPEDDPAVAAGEPSPAARTAEPSSAPVEPA